MRENDRICGFIVTRVRPAEEFGGVLVEMEHEKSGAKLAWLDRDEENKTFCIAFRTVPSDDTGVFHILEHSVLNGSARYPVKEPFVELLKTSLQTFLNALTYPDKTAFPVSSRNERDFENLTRVYLDAVFFPRADERREIFDQEGWHYEPAEDGYTRNGVVFSEMKGAFSSADEIMLCELNRLLYPDSCYRFVSGGHPDAIPTLTWEQFTAAHKTFYHPSNARIFLDGRLPIERILGLLDGEYLSRFERRAADFPIAWQAAPPHREAVAPYPAPAEGEEHAAHLALGWLAGRYDEREKLTALRLLGEYLTDGNDAPLTRAILSGGLGQNAEAYVNGDMLQPEFLVVVRNTDPALQDGIINTVRETLETAAAGLDRERMDALMNRMEFRVREQDPGWATPGVGLALAALECWNYGGDPMDGLRDLSVLRAVREQAKSGYFERLCRELLERPRGDALVLLAPDREYEAKRLAQEAEAIRRAMAGMTDAEKAETGRRFERMRAAQQAPDSEAALRTLPRLSPKDAGEPEADVPTDAEAGGGMLFHDIPTRDICYLNLYFPMGSVTPERLPAASLLTALLGELATANYSAKALRQAVTGSLGSFGAGVTCTQNPEQDGACTLYLRVSCSVLEEKKAEALRLLPEIVLRTRFDDAERIEELLKQTAEDLRQGMIEEGQKAALTRAESRICAAGAVAEQMTGLSFYRFVRELLKDFPRSFPALKKELDALRNELAGRAGMIVSITGKKDPAFARQLMNSFPEGGTGQAEFRVRPLGPARQGLVIPASVGYAAAAARLPGAYTGAHAVLGKLLSYAYFWQEVRVKGGAYGTGLRVSPGGTVSFYSFRDPNPAHSLQVYRDAAQVMRATPPDASDLDGVILGTLAALEPLRTPEEQGEFADSLYFSGRTGEWQRKIRAEVLTVTPERLAELWDTLDSAAAFDNICVAGSRALVDACRPEQSETL